MSLSFIGPDRNTLTEDHDLIAKAVLIEDSLIQAWLSEIGEVSYDLIHRKEDQNGNPYQLFFDAGGSVSLSEKVISTEINGITVKIYLRHGSHFLSFFKKRLEQKQQRNIISCWHYCWVLTYDSLNKIVDWLDYELNKKGGIGTADQLQAKHEDMLKKSGIVVR